MVDQTIYSSGSCRAIKNSEIAFNQVGSLNKINKAFSKFEQENERTPSPEELADVLELPKEKVTDTLKVSGRHVSVDAPFIEGEDNSLLDVLTNSDSPVADKLLMDESLSREIYRALATLTERERDIISFFFGIGCQEMTLEEIGENSAYKRTGKADQGKSHKKIQTCFPEQIAEGLFGLNYK
jgi:RNA polymerase primary sigma factor